MGSRLRTPLPPAPPHHASQRPGDLLLKRLVASHSCKAEARNCTLTDNHNAEWDDLISSWSSVCSTRTTAAITTPSPIVATGTYDYQACNYAEPACETWTNGMSGCAATETDTLS